MPVTPEYELSLRTKRLADIVSACPVWQALVDDPDLDWDDLKTAIAGGAGDATAARARINLRRKDESEIAAPTDADPFDAAYWPRIVLDTLRDSAGKVASFSWEGTAEFELHVEIPIPAAYRGLDDDAVQDATIYHENVMGLLRSQILEQSQNVLSITQIAVDGIDQCDPAEVNNNPILFCRFLITIMTCEVGE
jgi:hypothetical protein